MRYDAIIALGRIKDKKAVEPLISELESELSGPSARVLGEIGETEAIEPLLKALKEAPETSKIEVAWALKKLAPQMLAEPLIEEFYRGKDDSFLSTALRTLGEILSDRSTTPIPEKNIFRVKVLEMATNSLMHEKWIVRSGAVSSLGFLGGLEVLEPIKKALTDPEVFVVMSAIDAIATIEGIKAADSIIPFLGSLDIHLRNKADIVLESLGWEPHEPPHKMVRALRKDDYRSAIEEGAAQSLPFLLEKAEDNFCAKDSAAAIFEVIKHFVNDIDDDMLKKLANLENMVQRYDGEYIGGEIEKTYETIDCGKIKEFATKELKKRGTVYLKEEITLFRDPA